MAPPERLVGTEDALDARAIARHAVHDGPCWTREACAVPGCELAAADYLTVERNPPTGAARRHCHHPAREGFVPHRHRAELER